MTSLVGFKARVYPSLVCFSRLCAMDSSDSLLTWHLLTFWQPAWQPNLFDPHTYKHVHKYWWDLNRRLLPIFLVVKSCHVGWLSPIINDYPRHVFLSSLRSVWMDSAPILTTTSDNIVLAYHRCRHPTSTVSSTSMHSRNKTKNNPGCCRHHCRPMRTSPQIRRKFWFYGYKICQ